jgi:hypothetical protein
MVTIHPFQDVRAVTNDDHAYAPSGEVIRHYALRLYEAQTDFIRGGSIFPLLGPIGVLQREGVSQSDIETVIRAASRRLPFPFDLFQETAA